MVGRWTWWSRLFGSYARSRLACARFLLHKSPQLEAIQLDDWSLLTSVTDHLALQLVKSGLIKRQAAI